MLTLLFVAAWCSPSPDVVARLETLDELDASAEGVPPHSLHVIEMAKKLADEYPHPATKAAYESYTRMYAPKNERPEAKRDEATLAEFQKLRAECKQPTAWLMENALRFASPELPKLLKQWRAASLPASLLPQLWQLELAVAGAGGIDAVRVDVRADLARLKGDSLTVLSARQAADEILNQRSDHEKLLTKYPYSEAALKTFSAMSKEFDERDDAAQRAWLTKYPGHFEDDRLHALGVRDDLDAAQQRELAVVAAAVLKTWRSSAHPNPSMPMSMWVANAFIKHKVELGQVPGLLSETEAALKKPFNGRLPPELLAKNRQSNESRIRTLRVQYALAKNDFVTAEQLLDGFTPDKYDLGAVSVARARLLHQQGKFGDALVLLLPYADKHDGKVALQAVWTDLNGSPEALQQLRAGAPQEKKTDTERWEKIGKMLPKVTLTDNKGRKWTNKDFAGKRVFINVWASWCGPCKEELPHVARLQALAKDLLVLTANIDEDPAAAAAYLALHPLPLPVLMNAHDTIGATTAATPIPRSWLLDGGTLTHEMLGFSRSDDWAERTLAQIEALTKK